MSSIYVAGGRLMLSFKDASGKWVAKSSRIAVGDTAEERARNMRRAMKMLEAVVAGIARQNRIAAEEKGTGPLTVQRYLESWVKRRRGRVHTVRDEETRIRLHAVPRIGEMKLQEVRPRHIRDVIRALRDEGQLAPRTIRHVYGSLHTMFRSAVVEELIEANPCALGREDLPKKADKDPAWRATAVFTRGEVEALISDERIPIDRRFLYALLGLTGCRFGEVAAFRWRAYDRGLEPLGCLSVHASYNVRTNEEKEVKTGMPRRMPVHATLARMLAEWKLSGWSELVGRAAKEDDLIIPSRRNQNRRPTHGLTKFHEDLDRLGLRRRRLHDLRRTFISLALADGARKDILRWVTHGPEGDIVDLYTTLPWATLCEEVAKFRISIREGQVIEMPAIAAVGQGGLENQPPPAFYAPSKSVERKDVLAEVHGNRNRTGDAGDDRSPLFSIAKGRRINEVSADLAEEPAGSRSTSTAPAVRKLETEVADALERARSGWVERSDRRGLRKALLAIVASLDDEE